MVTLTLPFIRYSKKNFCKVPGPGYIDCQINQDDRTSGVVCTSRKDRQTKKRANKHRNRQTAVTNILCENRRFRKVTNIQRLLKEMHICLLNDISITVHYVQFGSNISPDYPYIVVFAFWISEYMAIAVESVEMGGGGGRLTE